MADEKIRIATSIPSLKNKVKTNLTGSMDTVYWYIRFNIPLDETSVSGKTMSLTDTEGYIMRTDIFYNDKTHMIVISPLDTYEQNRFYLLNISKKVRSARGQNLHSTIHILFKLLDNQIADYQIMKKNVKVPKPRPRPRDYDQRQLARRLSVYDQDNNFKSNRRDYQYPVAPELEAFEKKQKTQKPKKQKPPREAPAQHRDSRKSNVFDQEYMDRMPRRDRMSYISFRVNFWVTLIGLLMLAGSLISGFLWLIIVSALVCIGGLVYIGIQMRDRELYSRFFFNKGVWYFNRQFYRRADRSFRKARAVDPDNELAKYGIYKVGLYL